MSETEDEENEGNYQRPCGLIVYQEVHNEIVLRDPLVERLIEDTNWRIRCHNARKHFVLTPAFDAAVDLIQQYGKVIIIGLPGDGKTELGLEILRYFRDIFSMDAAVINTPSEWRKMRNGKRKCILLIDDIFGSDYFERKKLDKWHPHLDDVGRLSEIDDLDLQNFFIVITSRKCILSEGLKEIRTSRFKEERLFNKKYFIDMTTDFRLDRSHKTEIMDNYLDQSSVRLSQIEQCGKSFP